MITIICMLLCIEINARNRTAEKYHIINNTCKQNAIETIGERTKKKIKNGTTKNVDKFLAYDNTREMVYQSAYKRQKNKENHN